MVPVIDIAEFDGGGVPDALCARVDAACRGFLNRCTDTRTFDRNANENQRHGSYYLQ